VQVLVFEHALKHGLTEAEILHAWENQIRWVEFERDDGNIDIVAIGFDMHGRAIEMTGRVKKFGILIYHANTPPTARAFRELEMEG